MPQLALFEGTHLPRTAAREALLRGDLDASLAELARMARGTEEAADAARLERITSLSPSADGDPVSMAHDAFTAALAAREPRGFLSDAEWFRAYARRVAAALEADPERRFRGWQGLHFAFAAGAYEPAQRAAERSVRELAPGPAWIEAARLAFELGNAANARSWIHRACLDSAIELGPAPPALEPCGIPALDAARLLPRLPPPVEDVFEVGRELEGLPGPWTRWVAVVGEIDRVLAPGDASGEETIEGDAAAGDPARAFLAALRAARRSRERDRAARPGRCSDRELRARKRMQRIAPQLLARYVRGVGAALL